MGLEEPRRPLVYLPRSRKPPSQPPRKQLARLVARSSGWVSVPLTFSRYGSTLMMPLVSKPPGPTTAAALGSRICVMRSAMPSQYGHRLVAKREASIARALRTLSSYLSLPLCPNPAGWQSATRSPSACSWTGSAATGSRTRARDPSSRSQRMMMEAGSGGSCPRGPRSARGIVPPHVKVALLGEAMKSSRTRERSERPWPPWSSVESGAPGLCRAVSSPGAIVKGREGLDTLTMS